MAQTSLFPVPSYNELRATFVGKPLRDAPTPSAVLDLSKIKQNCNLMLDAASELNLGFRAHVKTHKTAELTRLQVGEHSKDVRLIVSTVIEAESLLPMLKDYQSKGAKVNVLYGIPLGASKVSRLAAVANQLGPGTITAMIDNPAQLPYVQQFKKEAGTPICVFIKADSGYHRAGIGPTSDAMVELLQQITRLESDDELILLGFYAHNSLSYNGNNPDDAMSILRTEIEACRQAAKHLTVPRSTPLTISVGASPTALSIQNIRFSTSSSAKSTTAAQDLLSTLTLTSSEFALEIHAGVYPVFDMQQIAASSRVFLSDLAAHQAQALTILTEVLSIYPTRTASPEALVSAGTLALGREPCKSYSGWGVLSAWNIAGRYSEQDSVNANTRMIVKRISQEHGIVGWEDGARKDVLPVQVGDKVRLWVNHACIAAAGFGWYLVVEGGSDVIQDVWVRWRGW